jgi:predicted lysophospholipase L1 biosynthesis ABC-type transport system permease subunit
LQVDRRAVLGGLAAAVAISAASPSEAAYGDAARVFAGTITNKSGACGVVPLTLALAAETVVHFPFWLTCVRPPLQVLFRTPARALLC